MPTPTAITVTVRALIVDRGELFMVKHGPTDPSYALPGGRLEPGETIEAGLIRELIEETNVRPDPGPLLFVNQWIVPEQHRVEFFFWVRNGHAYRQADPAGATHGFELSDAKFGDAADPAFNLLPAFLREKFSAILKLGEHYPTEIISSN